uniref:Uncharacterized protein n=1 Tax=Anopheles atroparvus TaxID=41427 RepID=A0A182JF70_ANOAO
MGAPMEQSACDKPPETVRPPPRKLDRSIKVQIWTVAFCGPGGAVYCGGQYFIIFCLEVISFMTRSTYLRPRGHFGPASREKLSGRDFPACGGTKGRYHSQIYQISPTTCRFPIASMQSSVN